MNEMAPEGCVAVCKECRDGKHGNCDGSALDMVTDEIVVCRCTWGHP